jgi:hypothetical protein
MFWMMVGGLVGTALALAYLSDLRQKKRYYQNEQTMGTTAHITNTAVAEVESRMMIEPLDRP